VAQALNAGLTKDFLEGPYVRRLFTGVYVPADVHVTDQVLVNGALMVLPADTLVTGVTALRQLGIRRPAKPGGVERRSRPGPGGCRPRPTGSRSWLR
jgi:hypothetical protein